MQVGILGLVKGSSSRRVLLVTTLVMTALVAGCTTRTTPAPITDLTAPRSTQTTHTVAAGDTLFSIAREHGVDVNALIRINKLDDPSQLHPGQVLHLRAQPAAAVGTQPLPPPAEPLPVTEAPPPQTSATQPTPPARTTRPDDANLIAWDWPASGRMLQTFNATTKGIDLEGQPGDPVKAAADGTVMYAGNGVRGLGNLVLLGHRDGFISAYAHNQVLLVKTGQQVKQGAQIAAIGQTDTTSPRLHFEIRRSGTPVDPLAYLPAR